MPRHRFVDTRDRIESAAIHLFVEKSVDGTTVRDIAGRVDLSEGALYRHFASKDDLVWQVFEKHYVALADEIRRLAAVASTTRGKIAAIIRGCCKAHDADPTLFRFLLFTQHGQLAYGWLVDVHLQRASARPNPGRPRSSFPDCREACLRHPWASSTARSVDGCNAGRHC